MDLIFEIEPIPKPRMTRRDKWAKRDCVVKYFRAKDAINMMAKQYKYELTEEVTLTFVIAMPKSWSKKKRDEMNGTPHRVKPDVDNLCKAFLDFFSDADQFVHTITIKKIWGETGKIIVHLT